MNKEIFLDKLREYLGILEDREQEDILAEYAQHIDMKMQKGLSEEEAIQDFGSMEELAAQILEAYHVKPQFSEKKKTINFLKPKGKSDDAEERKAKWKEGLDRIKAKAANAVRAVKGAFLWMGRKCGAFGRWLIKPFRRNSVETDGNTKENQGKERGTKEMAGGISRVIKATGKGISSLWRLCCDLCIWCLKLIWNLGWLMFALICAFMAMIALMGFGMISVFLFQNYPFWGIFFICLGGILCFGALSCGAFSLIIRKKKDGNGQNGEMADTERKETRKSDGEVQYE